MSDNEEDIIFQPRTEAIYKIVVIGDPAVGKTSLLKKYSSAKFQEKYIPTIGVNIVKKEIGININNKEINVALMLWDLAGQSQFYMLHRPYFNGADGIILVFDVTRTETFSNMNNWFNTAVKFGLTARVPRLLIGNKIDLKDERKIVLPHATHLSKKISAPYFETSALTGDNVQEIFTKIAEQVYRSKGVTN